MKSALAPLSVALIGLLAPCLAAAQGLPQSPAATQPLDVSRPQFDTTTPRYNVAGAANKAASTVIAEVGDRTITLGHINDAIRDLTPLQRAQPFETIYPGVLKQIAQLHALSIRAEREGLNTEPSVARRAKLAYDTVLANAALLQDASSIVTEKMILDRYDRDVASKPGPDEVEVWAILVATEAEADGILQELAGGADFAALARRSSKDSSAPAGGALEFRNRDVLIPEIAAVAFELSPGQTAPKPVRTRAGWFVLRAGAHRVGPVPPFSALHDEIRATLMQEAFPGIADATINDVTMHVYGLAGK